MLLMPVDRGPLCAPRVSPVVMNTPPPVRRRTILWVVFTLSLVPYCLPEQYQPKVYRDGKTPMEIKMEQRERMLNRVLGGDLRGTEFGADVLDALPDNEL